jgi:hypothetical protein
MITGKTKSGFEFIVSEHIADDWRVVKAVAESQSKEEAKQLEGTVKAVSLVLGDQEDALCEHIQREDGSIPTKALIREISDIMAIVKEKSVEIKN